MILFENFISLWDYLFSLYIWNWRKFWDMTYFGVTHRPCDCRCFVTIFIHIEGCDIKIELTLTDHKVVLRSFILRFTYLWDKLVDQPTYILKIEFFILTCLIFLENWCCLWDPLKRKGPQFLCLFTLFFLI